jgi:soluble lytic murein transglycosylase-like protein
MMTTGRLLLALMFAPLAWACTPTPELLRHTENAARAFGLEPHLLMALVWVESRYCPEAVSPKGAIGLGQLMPQTAIELGVDPADPAQNLLGAARYLRERYDEFGNWTLALAAYNAGPGNVRRFQGVPPFEETRRFVQAVLWVYTVLKER